MPHTQDLYTGPVRHDGENPHVFSRDSRWCPEGSGLTPAFPNTPIEVTAMLVAQRYVLPPQYLAITFFSFPSLFLSPAPLAHMLRSLTIQPLGKRLTIYLAERRHNTHPPLRLARRPNRGHNGVVFIASGFSTSTLAPRHYLLTKSEEITSNFSRNESEKRLTSPGLEPMT